MGISGEPILGMTPKPVAEGPIKNKQPGIFIHPKTNELVVPENQLIRPEPVQFMDDYLEVAQPRLLAQGCDIDGLTSVQKRALFKQLYEQDERLNQPFREYVQKGEEGIAELRKHLGLPRLIPLGQFISFAENIVADRDEAMRSSYPDLFQTGLLSEPIRKKLRIDHQSNPRQVEHLISHQSPNENRSITEVVSNAIDFSSLKDQVEVTTNAHGYTVRDHGKGMSPVDIVERLGIPFVSGARDNGTAKIGKFGMGFFTALDHLRTDGDMVRVRTGKDGVGYQFDYVYKNGSIFVSLGTQQDVIKGTEVTVQASEFNHDAATQTLFDDVRYKRGAQVLLNGKTLNDVASYETLEHREGLHSTAILSRGTPSLEKKTCKGNVLINGIRVEAFEVEGVNLPEEFILDLPYTSTLPESRNQVIVDKTVTSSFDSLIKELRNSSTDATSRIVQLNSLAEVLNTFSARSSGLTAEFRSLRNDLAELSKELSRGSNRQIVPAINGIENLALNNPLYVSDKVEGVGLQMVPGFTRLDTFKSPNTVLLIGEFKQTADSPMIKQGQVILFDKALYEAHKDSPGILKPYMKRALGDKFTGEFVPAEAIKKQEANEVPLTHDFADDIEKYLERILFTPRTTGHEALIDLLVPEYRHSRDYQYSSRKTSKIEISHEMAMKVLGYLSGENKEELTKLLDLGEKGRDKHDLMMGHFMGHEEGDVGDEGFIAYAKSSQHMGRESNLDQVSEMLQTFRPEAIKTLLALPPDEIEAAFSSALAGTITSSHSLYQIKEGLTHLTATTGFAYADKLIQSFGNKDRNRWANPPRDAEGRLFISMVEMATPLIKAYAGYKKAYGEEEQTPFLKEYLHLYLGANVIPEEESYRAVKGFAELVRRIDKPEELLNEVVMPLMQHPLVDRKQVFMGLLACVDTPAVFAMDYKPTDINRQEFWPQVAFDGPQRKAKLDRFEPYSSYYGREKLLLEQAPDMERKMRKALPIIRTNIEAVSALPSIAQTISEFGSEIEELRYGAGSYKSSTDQKPYVELFNTKAVLPEIDRFQTVLSQDHLHVLDQTLRDTFPMETMTKEKVEQELILINRAMGLAHLPIDKFTFAIPLMLHDYKMQQRRGVGNFGNIIFSDAVIDTLYERREAFQNLPVDSFMTFWEGIHINNDDFSAIAPVGELELQRLSRAIDIWQTVGGKPKEYQDLFFKESASAPPNKWKEYSWYIEPSVDPAEIPAHIRPYVFYYHEGDLAEKSKVEMGEMALPYNVNLSHLNLARRLQIKDYTEAIGQSDRMMLVVEAATRDKDTFVATRELIHAVEHLPAADPYLFLRELIQNSQDASLRDKSGIQQQIAVKDYRRDGQYIVEVSDTVGMNMQTVFGSLLPVGESTKGVGDRGRFGIGFLSILQGAERVEINTSDGQNTIHIQLNPIIDTDGALTDYKLSWNTFASDNKGTTIRKYTNDAQYVMESAFLHDAMIRYGTFIDARSVNVLFRDGQINREKTVLAERTMPGLGKLELLDGNETALLQGDLYVTQLPEYMKGMVPASIRDLVLEQGLVLNLDTSLELVRTRSDMAHRDTYAPLLSKILPGMVVGI